MFMKLSCSSLHQLPRLTSRLLRNRGGRSSARTLSTSAWADFDMAPLDPIIGLNEQYQKDDFPQKVIVGVGAYRDDAGKPYVLPCVREAEKILMDQNLDMEYAGIVSGRICHVAPSLAISRRSKGSRCNFDDISGRRSEIRGLGT